MSQRQDPTVGSAQAPDTGSNGHAGPSKESSGARRWSFFSNHAHVLVALADQPGARMRDLADRIGITERSVQRIVADLEAGGLIERHREGRRNAYVLHLDQPLPHPLETDLELSRLIEVTRAD